MIDLSNFMCLSPPLIDRVHLFLKGMVSEMSLRLPRDSMLSSLDPIILLDLCLLWCPTLLSDLYLWGRIYFNGISFLVFESC